MFGSEANAFPFPLTNLKKKTLSAVLLPYFKQDAVCFSNQSLLYIPIKMMLFSQHQVIAGSSSDWASSKLAFFSARK